MIEYQLVLKSKLRFICEGGRGDLETLRKLRSFSLKFCTLLQNYYTNIIFQNEPNNPINKPLIINTGEVVVLSLHRYFFLKCLYHYSAHKKRGNAQHNNQSWRSLRYKPHPIC
jgi:hypothetical protein